jgi:hypothetical protein
MDPEVSIPIYERTYNSYGMGFVVKDGHADFQIGCSNVVGLPVCDPWHLQKPPSFFPVLVDSIPKVGCKF